MQDENNPLHLSAAYDPKITDATWYRFWEEGGFFRADPDSGKPPYTIVMPPPNVTGVLHMGHALVSTLQDILIRHKRMLGFEVLWVPGTDHAGISTQLAVERYLKQSEGKRRTDYSREEFLERVWSWKERHESRILDQLKKMGASADWSRLRFTLDDGCSKAVRSIFKKLFDDGLIYRGDYLVNWDPVTQTALADDEVEYEEQEGFLWYFRFPLHSGKGFITIATTRPETVLGDVAVAVSPKDERYLKLHGQSVRHPITERILPIIVDNFVNPEFGTGAVKITPAHDPEDYRVSFHHKLELVNILTPDGRINEKGGRFAGLSREEAREQIVAAMKEKGLLEKVEPHKLRVGLSYRSKAIIEPYLSKQWFVRMGPFVENLKRMVDEGKVKIIPKQWEQTYFHWVNHLRDWCISRQLWWGHRIPVWHSKDEPGRMIAYAGSDLPPEVAAEPDRWEQDADVLDTWFSSALWPFSTLGWPEKTADLERFYPNSVLVTGHDILFFWVARMMAMGNYAMKEPPFPETFLHGLIYGRSYFRKNPGGGVTYLMGEEKAAYDLGKPLPEGVLSKWEKLSKSKGNVIDPLDLIETYGTDAVRIALCSCANQTPQIDLDRRRFEEFKHFANKVWNGARFVFMNLEDLERAELEKGLDENEFELEDRWILLKVGKAVDTVNESLARYSFDQAAATAYDFFWKDLCASYLEIAKPPLAGKVSPERRRVKQKLLAILLLQAIRLLHPIAPFITEELFQRMKKRFGGLESGKARDSLTQEMIGALNSPACIQAPYPQGLQQGPHLEVEAEFGLFERIVHAVRAIRGEMKIPPQTATELYLIGDRERLSKGMHILSALVKLEKIHLLSQAPPLSGLVAKGQVEEILLIVPLPSELAHKEQERLKKEKEKIEKRIEQLKATLNPDFLAKAAPEVIEKQKQSLSELQKSLTLIDEKLKG